MERKKTYTTVNTIILIKKIISNKHRAVPTYTNRLPELKLLPKLSFFLLKKKFFLYKKVKQPTVNYTRRPETAPGLGLHNTIQSYLKKIRNYPAVRHNMARRTYFYYKHKRRFRLLNKKNRTILFTHLKLYLKDKDKTRFILRTKNARKLDILRHAINLSKRAEFKTGTHTMLATAAVEQEQSVISYNHFIRKLSLKPRRTEHPTSGLKIRLSGRKRINTRFKRRKKNKIRGVHRITYTRTKPETQESTYKQPDYVDPRQLISINFKAPKNPNVTLVDYAHLNIFSYRTFNWGIVN